MRASLFERIKQAFIFWLARRLPDCKTITPKLSESIDQRPDLWMQLLIQLHMFTCGPCRTYLYQIKFISKVLHAAEDRLRSDHDQRVGLSTPAKERLKRSIQNAVGSV
jgi:hypothetical protein